MEGDEAATRRPGELSDNPLLAQMVFIKMEDIMDKLKLLNYEKDFCTKLRFKPFSRYEAKLASYSVGNSSIHPSSEHWCCVLSSQTLFCSIY